jgi:multiple sugar transport system permease protein
MKRYVLFAIGLCVTTVYLFPLYWMYITVFKSASEMFQYPPTFWPQHPVSHLWQVYSDSGMGKFLWNSLVTASGTVAVTVFVGTGAAIFTVLILQALPSSLMVTPIFTAFKSLGLLETPRLAVVIAQITKTLPFYIVLCRPSFVQVPRELRDAALVDGASPLRAFFSVILPLAINGILVSAILVFLQSFGEYVYARSLILDDQYQTATVGLSAFVGATKIDWIGIMTYSAIFVTPVLIAFMLLQRRIVAGLTAGALK